jgi:hypothetical protein
MEMTLEILEPTPKHEKSSESNRGCERKLFDKGYQHAKAQNGAIWQQLSTY